MSPPRRTSPGAAAPPAPWPGGAAIRLPRPSRRRPQARDVLPVPACPAVEDLGAADLLAAVAGRSRAASLAGDASLERLAGASPGELRALGLPAGAAVRLAAAFELGRRVGPRALARGAPVSTSLAIHESFRVRLAHLAVEQLWAVSLDAKNRVIREHLVSQGTLVSSPTHPREVFRAAIRAGAVGLVLVHNHPSGDPEPSPEDEQVTRRLAAAGDLLGIALLDHVVVADAGYVSFLERGTLSF